jgi:putative CocE/NonD family hydrolase
MAKPDDFGAECSTVDRRTLLQGVSALGTLMLSAGMSRALAARGGAESGPYTVRSIEGVEIPMPDGTVLRGRLWLPKVPDGTRVPAIFNYCPYHWRLFTRPEDEQRFPYYASHGYAGVRVDIRGSGNSEGKPQDEYVQQEQDDGLRIIEWIARQPWCSGKVGMEGLSWSGFSSLQVAACQPPALKAIITHCSTDDRYTDDAHYKGGCILHDMIAWGVDFLAFQGLAADPTITGSKDWKADWLARLQQVDFNLGTWLNHPHKDAFWKHASVNQDYAKIQCPVYAIGGWVDGYKNTVFRLLSNLSVPRKGLVGPWTHIYPHTGVPGPAIGYLQEALRWWDHWLKGKDTGIMREPALRVWMQDGVALPGVAAVPGRWAAEDRWPSPRLESKVLYLNSDGRLAEAAAQETIVTTRSPQSVGSASGNWCPSGGGGSEDLDLEIALDQRIDDARSLTFDSEILEAPLEILGEPELALTATVDTPIAYLAVRLNEIMPDGASRRVTYGILNLCHRDGSEAPAAVEPGRQYTVRLGLDHCAHRFAKGSRVRVAISTTYWPLILPSPQAATLHVHTGRSQMTLPVRPPRAQDAQLRAFDAPYVPPIAVREISSQPGQRTVEYDVRSRTQTLHHRVATAEARLPDIDASVVSSLELKCVINDDSPDGARMEYQTTFGWKRGGTQPLTIAKATVTAHPTELQIDATLHAFDGNEQVFERAWQQRIKRDLV